MVVKKNVRSLSNFRLGNRSAGETQISLVLRVYVIGRNERAGFFFFKKQGGALICRFRNRPLFFASCENILQSLKFKSAVNSVLFSKS